jgi:hypothetical protein
MPTINPGDADRSVSAEPAAGGCRHRPEAAGVRASGRHGALVDPLRMIPVAVAVIVERPGYLTATEAL